MWPITNFAKGRFSEIQSRVSNSLLELIQTLYFVQQSPPMTIPASCRTIDILCSCFSNNIKPNIY